MERLPERDRLPGDRLRGGRVHRRPGAQLLGPLGREDARLLAERDQRFVAGQPIHRRRPLTPVDRVGEVDGQIPAAQVERMSTDASLLICNLKNDFDRLVINRQSDV